MAKHLLIVDVQHGFINDFTRHVPALVEALQHGYATATATRFVNPEGSPYRRFIGWGRFAPGSAESGLAFAPAPHVGIIEKSRYSCVDEAFLERLRNEAAEAVHLCGIATDNCVLACATALFEAGIRPVVLGWACASHAGPDYHRWGLKILERLIGRNQVVREGDVRNPLGPGAGARGQ